MYQPLILSVLFICVYPSQSSIETDVQALIQKIKDALPEPIDVPEADIVIPDNKLISGFLNLANLSASGIKAFDLKVKFAFGLLPQNIKFNLDKLELDTDYLLQMPLFNLDFMKLFGKGKVYLSLSELSLNASISINITAPLKDLKLSLGAAQFTITGLLNDPDFNKELSEDLTRGMVPTVNSDNFAILVQNVLNNIVASIVKKKNVARVSSEEINDDLATESLYIVDLLSNFLIWIENAFRDYKSTPELENRSPRQ